MYRYTVYANILTYCINSILSTFLEFGHMVDAKQGMAGVRDAMIGTARNFLRGKNFILEEEFDGALHIRPCLDPQLP